MGLGERMQDIEVRRLTPQEEDALEARRHAERLGRRTGEGEREDAEERQRRRGDDRPP